MLNPTRSRKIACPDCDACGRIARLAGGSFTCRLCDGSGELTVTTPIGFEDELWEEVADLRAKKMPHLFRYDSEQCPDCGSTDCAIVHQ